MTKFAKFLSRVRAVAARHFDLVKVASSILAPATKFGTAKKTENENPYLVYKTEVF